MHGGFSAARPWLPVPAEHGPLSVATQDADTGSVLNGVRHLLRWRRTHPALVSGEIAFLDANEPVLVFIRRHDDESLLVAFNLSPQAQAWKVPANLAALSPLRDHGLRDGVVRDGVLELPPRGVFYARIG